MEAWKMTLLKEGLPWSPLTTQYNIDSIHGKIVADRQMTEQYSATELDISEEHVGTVTNDHFKMTNDSAHLVPNLLQLD